MRIPNIFKYATKELSQDALICWLVACAKESEGELRECGLAFVQALFNSGCPKAITKITQQEDITEQYSGDGCVTKVLRGPKPQYGKVDVYFQARVDGKKVSFVVEDKTHTEMHGDQLKRYLGIVKDDESEEDFIKLVYFKTGHVFEDERGRAKLAGYSVFDGRDMMKFLNEGQRRGLNEILRQYADRLEHKLNKRDKALDEWDLNKDFVQWEFMKRLGMTLERSAAAWPARGRNRGGIA